MTSTRIPFPENVPGDYYVESGCCASCGLPSAVAPGLFSYAGSGHCYVSKQPSDARETGQMIEAFQVQDLGCIRYRGTDRDIMTKLMALGEGKQCDQLDLTLRVRKR